MSQDADLLVLGGGPAGCAAAIAAAGRGLRVVLATRPAPARVQLGESLSPAGTRILRQFGCAGALAGDGHRPCHANRSAWGETALATHDFLRDPNGHAWHVDRDRLDARLRLTAVRLGVRRLRLAPGDAMDRGPAGWRVRGDDGSTRAAAPLAADATGRAAWLARRCGARRLREDVQVAVVGTLPMTGEWPVEFVSLVETTPDGWWYSAPLPRGGLTATLFTDPVTVQGRSGDLRALWRAALARAPRTAARIAKGHGDTARAKVDAVSAESGRLAAAAGPDWLAVGDAAMSLDPLSAHGLTMALAGGRDGGLAAAAVAAGQGDALAGYARAMAGHHARYAAMRRAYYGMERRWPEAPYWRRRMMPVPQTAG